MRRQWQRIGALSPPQTWVCDGTADLEVASRFGRLSVQRQILMDRATQTHVMPGNVVLPPHGGIVITRGLQELACLLADTLPFVTAARLLGAYGITIDKRLSMRQGPGRRIRLAYPCEGFHNARR